MNPIRITMQDHIFRDSLGQSWMPDQFGAGGRTIEHVGDIEGAKDSRLFAVERYGNFNYAIPVADGSYNLAVYMAEAYFGPENPGGGGPGTRVFDIYCNGLVLAREFDILSRVGANRMFVFQSYGLRPNAQGKLNLSFLPVVNYPSIFAIEVTSNP